MKDTLLRWSVMIHNKCYLFKKGCQQKLRQQQGAGTVEYALLVAVIVIGIVSAATIMFDPLKEFFDDVVKKVKEFAGV